MIDPTGKLTLRALVTMSHGHSSTNGTTIHLVVIDEDSGMCITDVEIVGEENVAKLFTSMQCHGTAEAYPAALPKYGLMMENRDVWVQIGNLHGDQASEMACDSAERENPGWGADSYCRKYNSHRKRKDGSYQVTIRRWVKS